MAVDEPAQLALAILLSGPLGGKLRPLPFQHDPLFGALNPDLAVFRVLLPSREGAPGGLEQASGFPFPL